MIDEELKEEKTGTRTVQVLDANGNIQTITTPIFKSKEKETIPTTDITTTPTTTDITTTPTTTIDTTITSPIVVGGELNDDEIIQQVKKEENNQIIDGAKENIFKTDGDEEILNFVIGDLDNAFKLSLPAFDLGLFPTGFDPSRVTKFHRPDQGLTLSRFRNPPGWMTDISKTTPTKDETPLETYRRTGYFPEDQKQVSMDLSVKGQEKVQKPVPVKQDPSPQPITPESLLRLEPIVSTTDQISTQQVEPFQITDIREDAKWIDMKGPKRIQTPVALIEFYKKVNNDPDYDYTKDNTLSHAQKNAIYVSLRPLDKTYTDKEKYNAKRNALNNEKTINTLALKHSDIFNINSGIVTDNSGNVISTKEDWVNAAVQQGDMFNTTASNIFDSTKNQFDKGKLEQNEEEIKVIDEAYDYLITSVSNETGNTIKNILNLGNIRFW